MEDKAGFGTGNTSGLDYDLSESTKAQFPTRLRNKARISQLVCGAGSCQAPSQAGPYQKGSANIRTDYVAAQWERLVICNENRIQFNKNISDFP